MQLALVVFLAVLLSGLINVFGKSALTAAVYAAYSRLFLGTIYAQQHSLKREILRNKSQLQVTSSQDQFAKWAKLRRKVDKGLAELEVINSRIASQRARFTSLFDIILSISSSGVLWAIVWWFRRHPVFWTPAGWVPERMAWLMSFGGGPGGSISVTIWLVVCKRVMNLLKTVWIESFWNILLEPISGLQGPSPMQSGGKAEEER